jgi:hypothetical protein
MQNHCQSDHFSPLLKAPTSLEQQCLWQIVQAHTELMQVLKTLQTLDATAYVAAGVLRHVVWAHLHAMSYSLSGTEIDVIFYDQDDEHALRLKHVLETEFPEIQWDVTNQATVHQWYRTEKMNQLRLYNPLRRRCHFGLRPLQQLPYVWTGSMILS